MKVGTTFAPPRPYDLALTVRLLQRRPTNPVDRWEEGPEGGTYLRLVRTRRGLVLAGARQRGSKVELLVDRGATAPQVRTAAATLNQILGLELPAPDFRPLARLSPELGALAAKLAGMRPPRFADLHETVLHVVPFQQVSLDAGTAVTRRLIERFGTEASGIWAAPEPGRIASARLDTLRRCGLSTAKARTLRSAARLIADAKLTDALIESLPSQEALEVLQELPGIGPWSAGLILLRGFRRTDVFPSGDAGVAKALSPWFPAPTDLTRAVASLGETRGHLYFLALGSQLLARGLVRPRLLTLPLDSARDLESWSGPPG